MPTPAVHFTERSMLLLNSFESKLSTSEQIICDIRVTFPFAHKS